MREPKYIIYVSNRNRSRIVQRLNIIRWSDKSVWDTGISVRPLKKFTSDTIENILRPEFSSATTVCWYKSHQRHTPNLYTEILYLDSVNTVEDIKKVLETFEACKFNYLYLIY